MGKTQKGNIKVVVTKLRTDDGLVNIGLYNTKESYLSRGSVPAFKKAKVHAKGNKAVYTFKNVPYGEYTIKLYHDENANGKIDLGPLNIPIEPYAFSNNAIGTALPNYSHAKFHLDSDAKMLELKLIDKFSRTLKKTD